MDETYFLPLVAQLGTDGHVYDISGAVLGKVESGGSPLHAKSVFPEGVTAATVPAGVTLPQGAQLGNACTAWGLMVAERVQLHVVAVRTSLLHCS